MINDFLEKSNNQFEKSFLSQNSNVSAELLALNFEMRSKKFMVDVNTQHNILT